MASMPDSPSFDELAPSVSRITVRSSPGYDEARAQAIWNKRLDQSRAPEAVVRVTSAEQAAETIRFAAAHGLKVSPRGSGHHYEAAALREGGILLDLGDLDFIEIDTEASTARVGAGVRGGVLSEHLAAAGLAFPAGHCVDVGLSGYILAGGFGWNAGEWGAACGNVKAIELVTAEGQIVLASADNHADLFWAARGAGAGFFAAVTAYHLQLHPLPHSTFAWRALFAVQDAPAMADWLSAATAAAHPAAEVGCFLLAHWNSGEPTVILRVSACGESEEEARDRLVSFKSPPAGAPLLSEPKAEALPFTDLPKLSPMPSGKRVTADHAWCDAPLGDLLLAVHDLRSPSRHSTVDLVGFGGHSRVALPEDAALSLGGGTGAGIYAMWDDPADDEANHAWVRQVDDALAPYRAGRYVGEADLTVGPGRVDECFTPAALQRLRALRQRYDPNTLFFAWP
jgi:FAD/FMN-containing dehydrogenase